MFKSGRYAPLLLLFLALAATGCETPTVVVLEDPRTYVEERSILDARKDARIRLDIQALFIERDAAKLRDVTVEVYETAIMLTGTVADAATKTTAGALATSVNGAGLLHNEIQILTDPDQRDAAADLAVETRIKKALREAEGVHSANMRWRCVNGSVYLFGRALSEAERDTALEIVRTTQGAKNVVDHMKVVPR